MTPTRVAMPGVARCFGGTACTPPKWLRGARASSAVLRPWTRKAPGPKPHPRHPLADDVTRLTRANARLQTQLANAELVIEIQKKVATLLGLATPTPPSDTRS